MWSLLGGAPEPGESPDEAIVRELREEAGLVIPSLRPFAVQERQEPDGSLAYVAAYVGRWDGDPDGLALSEGVMLRWVPTNMMERLVMCPATQDVILRHTAAVSA